MQDPNVLLRIALHADNVWTARSLSFVNKRATQAFYHDEYYSSQLKRKYGATYLFKTRMASTCMESDFRSTKHGADLARKRVSEIFKILGEEFNNSNANEYTASFTVVHGYSTIISIMCKPHKEPGAPASLRIVPEKLRDVDWVKSAFAEVVIDGKRAKIK